MISTTNDVCLKPLSNIVKFANEGIQTDEIWNESSINNESDESLIDLSSSFDDSEDSLSKSVGDTHLLPIALFGNDSSELCKTFCETYKEFFKDVYQEKGRLIEEETIQNKKTTTEGK